MRIIGKRINLRPPHNRDIPTLVRWFNNPTVTSNLAITQPVTEISEAKWLNDLRTRRAATDILWVIDTSTSKQSIGCIGLHKIDRRNSNAEISIAIGEIDYWGKGFAPEATSLVLDFAFSRLNMHRIYTGAYGFNTRSLLTLEKQGFVREGILKEAVFRCGQYHDTILFGLLREKWIEKNRIKQ